ncbi:NAD(P)/FAD-dependent oxidoreductase [Piscinibacter koreensis]|uniref:Ferredoxin--NADP reductase n=1 Tax=Piscinibacter koreensis TaxID=2742824 RepID=A0A7Y6NL55_9BURK|nr:NAD(P)/FAD-dependent oxidoreductase [Schlegelella koreensis]NUZ05099.1 NAD(P)/FAD-dependent oxidoreductase [Schlegelella koreensis]
MSEPHAPIETDALIVGAGPVGLFQVFQLGLLEVRAHVVDTLPFVGGQCIELYADKPIYDVPGLPVATGRELIERLVTQIAPFTAPLHLGQQVDRVAVRGDGRFDVETSAGTRFVATAVIVAGGAGSFQPRTLKLEGLDRHRGSQVFYRRPDAAHLAGQRVLIAGGGVDAVELATSLASDSGNRPAEIVLMHRRDDFSAGPEPLARLAELRQARRIRVVVGQPNGLVEAGDRLVALEALLPDGGDAWIAFDTLVIALGVSPKLGPIADWGLGIQRKQVTVDTERFQSTTPGIFAVGDINTYPGKRKLIVSGFHEATLAAFAAAAIVHPDRALPLQYTTTSPRLHRLLGVDGADGERPRDPPA